MFRKKSQKDAANQIPADLFATIHSSQARRKRWMIELGISLVIVVLLLVGGMLIYKKLNRTNEPNRVPESNAQQVMQPPQESTEQQESGGTPSPTPGSDTTNAGSVPRPE